MDGLHLSPVVLCGLSMGGYVAFECLRRWPERISALILMDTKAQADDARAKRARTDAMDAVGLGGTGAIVEAMLPALLSPETLEGNPDLVKRIRAMMREAPPSGVVGALEAMLERSDSTDLLSHIAVPTLVLVGQDDRLTPPQVARTMAGAIPGAECLEVAGAGHLVPLEQPEVATAAVAAFLDAALKPGR